MFITQRDLRLHDVESVSEGLPSVSAACDLFQKVRWSLPEGRRSRGPPSLFASLSFASVSAAQIVGKVEKKTGTEFPEKYCHLTKNICPVLTGVGVRNKRLLGMKNIDVYSLGLYVDPSATKKLAGKYKGQSAEALATNQKLLDELAEAKGPPKTLRVFVTTKLLTSSRFFNGLRESLVPALKKVGEDESSLVVFEKLFDGAQFRRGYDLTFSSTSSGALAVQIAGKEVGKVDNPKLTTAFFGLYLGPAAVSQDAKLDIGKGLAKLITE